MAKAFFRQNPTSLVWEYGTFKADGITPSLEFTAPAGLYRSCWQTINGIVLLTIFNANNSRLLDPFNILPITDVASDLIGTPYANRAAFETATKDFFFNVAGSSGSSLSTYAVPVEQVTGSEDTFTMDDEVDTSAAYFASVDGIMMNKGIEITITNVDSFGTAVFSANPEASASIVIYYSPL
jgi:hypothetical protein